MPRVNEYLPSHVRQSIDVRDVRSDGVVKKVI